MVLNRPLVEFVVLNNIVSSDFPVQSEKECPEGVKRGANVTTCLEEGSDDQNYFKEVRSASSKEDQVQKPKAIVGFDMTFDK